MASVMGIPAVTTPSRRKKWYVVCVGQDPGDRGVYNNWPEVAPKVLGVSGAVYQGGFQSQSEAEIYLASVPAPSTTPGPVLHTPATSPTPHVIPQGAPQRQQGPPPLVQHRPTHHPQMAPQYPPAQQQSGSAQHPHYQAQQQQYQSPQQYPGQPQLQYHTPQQPSNHAPQGYGTPSQFAGGSPGMGNQGHYPGQGGPTMAGIPTYGQGPPSPAYGMAGASNPYGQGAGNP
jgi:hypothetical protein